MAVRARVASRGCARRLSVGLFVTTRAPSGRLKRGAQCVWPSCPNAIQPERHQGSNPDGLNLSRSTKGANPGSNPRRGWRGVALQALDSLALNKRSLAGSSFELVARNRDSRSEGSRTRSSTCSLESIARGASSTATLAFVYCRHGRCDSHSRGQLPDCQNGVRLHFYVSEESYQCILKLPATPRDDGCFDR